MDPRRDIDDECGYPATENIRRDEYRELYDREPIATRVVQLMPRQCWKTSPSVFETEDVGEITKFEGAWNELGRSLRGTGWYQDQEGNPIWEYLQRADELSGIGSYGVLLLGIDDGLELSEPIEGVETVSQGKALKEGRRLLFLRAFDESLAQITAYEEDVTSPRFGQPVKYNLSFSDVSLVEAATGTPLTTKEVHWTRVVHLADNLGSSEVIGVPRMRPVLNRIMDLRKLYGGSAEMYWRGAFPGLSLETDPSLGEDVEVDTDSVKDALENYMNGLQRYITLQGMTANSLAPQVVDPTPQIDAQIQAICIKLGVPKRIFMGSERGELSSTQDESAWNDEVRGRQNGYVTPRIIVPVIDRLIVLGILPTPKGYSVVWPDLDAMTEDEQAGVAVKRTDAMAKYVQGGVEALIPPLEYFVNVLGFTQEEAAAILEATMEHIKEVDALEAEDHALEREEGAEDRAKEHDRLKELQQLGQ
jgi:hypothetical protein